MWGGNFLNQPLSYSRATEAQIFAKHFFPGGERKQLCITVAGVLGEDWYGMGEEGTVVLLCAAEKEVVEKLQKVKIEGGFIGSKKEVSITTRERSYVGALGGTNFLDLTRVSSFFSFAVEMVSNSF